MTWRHPIQAFKEQRRSKGVPTNMPTHPAESQTESTPKVAPEQTIDALPRELLWLLDAPLFIDELQVNAFYDAILKPDFEGASITLSNSITNQTTIGGSATVGANMPWLKAEGTVTGQHAQGKDSGRDTTYTPVSNAYRHLLALALHYAAVAGAGRRLAIPHLNRERQVDVEGDETLDDHWLNDDFIKDLPRALVFLDIPKGARFIPTALELTNGEVQIMAEALADKLSHKAKVYPKEYPGSKATEVQKDEYFGWFDNDKIWDDRIALKVLEDAVLEHRVAWVAFNVAVKSAGEVGRYLHLHIAARGQYDTGVFAYNFITRGFNYGVRIVGTLKSGPDMNVLAIFES